MLGRDQLEDRIAQVFEALVVRRSALRVFVVVGAMRQRLPKQSDVVEPDPKGPLELL
jgi:hypothetical protein